MKNKIIECPLCYEKSYPSFIKNSHQIMACSTCSYEFIQINDSFNHVLSVYDDFYFEAGDAGYPNYLENEQLLIKKGERYSRWIAKLTRPGRIFDIGSAAGFFLKGFINKGWTGQGLEPNMKMVKYANDTLGLDVKPGVIENYQSDDKYDLLTMIQVVPHFFDLEMAFVNAANLTKEGGFWLIESWNKNSITAKIFGKNWHEYNPPSVIRWFSKTSLENYVKKYGFKLIFWKHPVTWISAKHGKNIIEYNLRNHTLYKVISELMKLIPDSFDLPYYLDDLFLALFRKI